jgi:hypothetical protein
MPNYPQYLPNKPCVIAPAHQPDEIRKLTDGIRQNRIYRNAGALNVVFSATALAIGERVGAFNMAFYPMHHDGSANIRKLHGDIADRLAIEGDYVSQKARMRTGKTLPTPTALERTHPHFLVDGKGNLVFLPKGSKLEVAKQKIHDWKEEVALARDWVPVRFRGTTKFSK